MIPTSANKFSESTYRQILDSITDMVFVKDKNSNLLWTNQAFSDYFNTTTEQLRGVVDTPVNNGRVDYQSDDQKVFRTGKVIDVPEEIIVKPDGSERLFHTLKCPIFEKDTEVSLLVGLSRDITERIASDDRLKRSENLLTSILENSPSIVYAKNLQGEMILVNSQACKLLGLSKEEAIGKKNSDLFSEEIAEKISRDDLEVITTGRDRQFEETVDVRGLSHTFMSVKFPLRNKEGDIYAVCGISTDISDKKRAEFHLAETQARSIVTSKFAALGEMAGGIAHEINTPLATLKTLSNQLSDTIVAPEIDRNLILKMAQIIEKTTDRIAAIVRNLRTFARDGSSDPMTRVSVKNMIADTLTFCRGKLIGEAIDLCVSDISESATFYGREVEISQVLVNLLNNAYDAVAGEENKKISIDVAEGHSFIQIAITDSGPGIPAEVREKIFQPFHTTKEIGKGTGLGLPISKRIVESHTGTLTLDLSSSATRFIIMLPKSTTN